MRSQQLIEKLPKYNKTLKTRRRNNNISAAIKNATTPSLLRIKKF
jgi:hypothetical protein